MWAELCKSINTFRPSLTSLPHTPSQAILTIFTFCLRIIKLINTVGTNLYNGTFPDTVILLNSVFTNRALMRFPMRLMRCFDATQTIFKNSIFKIRLQQRIVSHINNSISFELNIFRVALAALR